MSHLQVIAWLSNETAKRKSVLNAGEDAVLKRLKPLGDVMDLSDPSEVKKLAALVPMMKSADGGMHDCPTLSATNLPIPLPPITHLQPHAAPY